MKENIKEPKEFKKRIEDLSFDLKSKKAELTFSVLTEDLALFGNTAGAENAFFSYVCHFLSKYDLKKFEKDVVVSGHSKAVRDLTNSFKKNFLDFLENDKNIMFNYSKIDFYKNKSINDLINYYEKNYNNGNNEEIEKISKTFDKFIYYTYQIIETKFRETSMTIARFRG